VNVPDVGVPISALATWMDEQGLGAGPIEDIERANSNETMRREARVLAALANTEVPHPHLIAASTDESVLGAVFYLMEPVSGFNPTTGLPSLHAGSAAIRHQMGLNLVDGAATLGNLDYAEVGLSNLGNPNGFLDRQVKRWSSQLASYADLPGWTGPDQLPSVDRVARWLEAHQPGSFKPGIMHGDYHLANAMFKFDGPELAAIVDWELTTIGDPLLDLGWLLATWPDEEHDTVEPVVTPWHGFPTPGELVDRYGSRSERDLSAVNWYAVLACFKLGILLEGTHARACAGRAPRETGDTLHEQAISLFHRALRWIG
jgi:aminoglycoside phosphotransferase (APT) family kinase protein